MFPACQDRVNTSPLVLRDACRGTWGSLPLSSNNMPSPYSEDLSCFIMCLSLLAPCWKPKRSPLPADERRRRICSFGSKQSLSWGSSGGDGRRKELYQLVILLKCLLCSAALVRGPYFMMPLLWNLPWSISSGSVLNVARTANGQTFILLLSPHYKEREMERREREKLRYFFSFRDKYFDVYTHSERRRQRDRERENCRLHRKHFRPLMKKQPLILNLYLDVWGNSCLDPVALDSCATLMSVI